MKVPVQITFRNMERDRAIEEVVRRKSIGLEKYFPRMMGCRVVIEAPHRRHRSGDLFHVRVDATVPGKELVVRRDPREHGSHANVRVAIRDAFDATRRELMDEARRRRDCRFLLDRDGREIYFHANSVLDGF